MAGWDGHHIGRSFGGTGPIEENCPCPKRPCGLVAANDADPLCKDHGREGRASKTIRSAHKEADCPGPSSSEHLTTEMEAIVDNDEYELEIQVSGPNDYRDLIGLRGSLSELQPEIQIGEGGVRWERYYGESREEWIEVRYDCVVQRSLSKVGRAGEPPLVDPPPAERDLASEAERILPAEEERS